MSTLVDRSGRVPSPGPQQRPRTDSFQRSPVVAGALIGLQSVAASLAVVLVPVVLAWATASYSRAPWGQAVHVGVASWLLAHHTGIVIPGGHLGLMPIGLTLIPLISCWLAGVKLARGLDPNAEAIRAGIGRARPVAPPPRALWALIVTYTATVTLIAAVATTSQVRPLVGQAFVGSGLICAIAGVAGAAAWRRGGVLKGLRLLVDRLRLPMAVRWSLRPALLAVATQLAGAVLLLLIAVALGWHRILILHQALAPGLAGGLVLLIAQLAVVPNAVIWSGAYLAGPGFSVGSGTAVLPGHTDLGAVPAVPILGALPVPGEGPGWIWAVLAVPVLAGVVAGIRINRRVPTSTPALDVLLVVAVTAMLSGLAWAVLGWLASGPAGPGRLARMGPSGWQVGLVVAAEVGLGAVLTVGLGLLARLVQPAQSDDAEQ